MPNSLKEIVSPPSLAAQPVAASPTSASVDPYMLESHNAVLSGWLNQETNKLFSGSPVSAEDTVLDVGCGDDGSVHFCVMCGARIIITDVDVEKIARIRERLADIPAHELECLVNDYGPLLLIDATATRIVSTEVVEHVDDPRQFLAELVWVGQPSALYLLDVSHPALENLQKGFVADEYFRKLNHIRVLGEKQFAVPVCETGLETLSHDRYGFYWSLWMLLFWEAKVDFGNPGHPLLEHWARTWQALLDSPRGPATKQALDAVVAKSQVVIVRKPAQAQSHRDSPATTGRNSCRSHRIVPSSSRVIVSEQTSGPGAS